jgi:hypothetical protein
MNYDFDFLGKTSLVEYATSLYLNNKSSGSRIASLN